MYVQAINETTAEHLAETLCAMREYGRPTIRIYDIGDMCIALEGSHRLAAAWALGFEPDFIEMEEDEIMTDCDVYDFDGETVGELVELLLSRGMTGERYDIDQFAHENRDYA